MINLANRWLLLFEIVFRKKFRNAVSVAILASGSLEMNRIRTPNMSMEGRLGKVQSTHLVQMAQVR